MFKLEPNPVFAAIVRIPLPGGGHGDLDVDFRPLGRKAFDAWLEGGAERSDTDWLLPIIAGWRNASADFSGEALEGLLDQYPLAGRALFDAYVKALFEASEKN